MENEDFSVLASLQRSHWLDWLDSGQNGFDLYTDHNDLIFILYPLKIIPDIEQGVVSKVLRWDVRLYAYKYVCFHIFGEDNIWAEILTTWDIQIKIGRSFNTPPLPPTFRDLEWPSRADVRSSKARFENSRPNTM